MLAERVGSPLWSGLAPRGRAELQAAGQVRRLAAGGVAFARGDPADTLWFVTSGAIELESARGTRRVGERDHFGSDALLRGASRTEQARALTDSTLLEVPVAALERILVRAGVAALFAREAALARRQAFATLLLGTPFGQALGEPALAELFTRVREESRARGSVLFDPEQPAEAAYVVASGLVELAGPGGKRGFLARGDVLGLEAARRGAPPDVTATALGDVTLLVLPAALVRELCLRQPQATARAEGTLRAKLDKQARGQALPLGAATRRAVHELERLASAQSLLAIELERCVRCGECVRACADTHGTARLTRRGDKAVLAVDDGEGFAARALLFPQACQHCRDPACLVDCPTGAITRGPLGVALALDLCTGCGACAKACPWDAIRMAPRGAGGAGTGALVAHKCDLCSGRAAPECVSACPTAAIFRADPERDLVEVRSLLGAERRPPSGLATRAETPPARNRTARWLVPAALVPPLVAFVHSGLGVPSAGQELVTGALAGVIVLTLLAHGLVKRHLPLRAWVLARALRGRARRGLAPLVAVHGLLGLGAVLLVLAHAGFRPAYGAASLARLAFWLVAATGGLGALAYRLLPRRLARLERRGSLPEDHPAEHEALTQQLYGGLSEQSVAMKELARRVLLPYASAAWGGAVLLASGRAIGEEEAALTARVERLLDGKKSERLTGVAALVTAAVALRALGARRLLEGFLGIFRPVHLVLSALLALALVVHVVGTLGGP